MAFKQTVIRHKTEGGKIVRKVVRHGTDIQTVDMLGFPTVVFEDQENHDLHAVSKSLVVEVFIEEENPKYATFHKVEKINL